MKLRYLRTFEHFNNADDMGRFSQMDSDEQDWLTRNKRAEEEEEIFNSENDEESEEEEIGECPTCNNDGCPECKPEEEEENGESNEPRRRKVWGDEVIEKKKFNFEKGKKDDKKSDKKEDKKEGGKGLSAAQKKLPEGLRKAIEAKKKK